MSGLSLADEVDGTGLNVSGAESESYEANELDSGADGSAVIGIGSYQAGVYSGIVGIDNSIDSSAGAFATGNDNVISSGDQSFSAGLGNYVHSGASCFVAGSYNDVTSDGQIILGQGIVASLSTGGASAMIVGNYNLEVTNQLFVIGNGTGSGATPRHNAVEVYKDGTVKILKRQGDVGMGRFTTVIADQ
jgi:hypothetical protein